ncbi:MAG: hypothetical protein IKG53_04470 [Solobacterium sp.]|nr:hypothetical protein [Solobacterium sp.]
MTRINEVYAAIKKDPSLLSTISKAENTEAVPTRAMPGMSEPSAADALREILGSDVSEEELNKVAQELDANNIYRLYKESDGTIDPAELIEYAGGLDGTDISKDNPSLKALFDGKLQLKEILLIILLLKLFKKKKQEQPAATSPLQSLFGGQQQQQTPANPLQSLFGTQQQQQTPSSPLQFLFGTPQQQQTPVYGNNLFGSLLSGSQQQPSSNTYTIFGNSGSSGSNSLLSLFGLDSPQPNYNNASNNLFNFISGNNVSQSPSLLQTLYGLLNQAPSNSVHSNGQINVGTVFSILNALMNNK